MSGQRGTSLGQRRDPHGMHTATSQQSHGGLGLESTWGPLRGPWGTRRIIDIFILPAPLYNQNILYLDSLPTSRLLYLRLLLHLSTSYLITLDSPFVYSILWTLGSVEWTES